MIQEVIVVEGHHDTQAIHRAVGADTIETGGSALPEHVLAEIKRAQKRRGVIVFTDPDAQGERIRRLIAERVPGVKHAFLPREKAKGKGKIGIEHADDEAIRQALQAVRTAGDVTQSKMSWDDYLSYGLAGRRDSARLRRAVADALQIGYANGKQFFKRLQVLQIDQNELAVALQRVRKDWTE